MILRNIFI